MKRRCFSWTICMGKVLLVASCAFLVVVCAAFREGASGEESGRPSPLKEDAAPRGGGSVPNPGAWLLSLFRDHISAVDGDRCPSFPSCSAYGTEAFKKHGLVMGWLMTVDRLVHEADEGAHSPRVYHGGRMKIYDPVANNDFWWYRPDENQNNEGDRALDAMRSRDPL